MVNKSDTRESKNKRIIEALDKIGIGEIISPSDFFRSIEIHPNTGRDMLDLYDSLRQIPFEILRNPDGEIKAIVKTEEQEVSPKNLIKELKEIKKILEEMKNDKKK